MEFSLQVGDMGIGFPDYGDYSKDGKSWSPIMPSDHMFFNGNHDNPLLCKTHPNYLGDWGYIPDPNMFYVSGGFSIDHAYRFVDMTWWKDEELNNEEMSKALDSYKINKPKIVVSHECPLGVKIDFVTNSWKFDVNSRTEELLQSMFEIHQPDYWIFGHHHQRKELDKNGTHFVCLGELMYDKVSNCIYEIPDLTWEGKK